MYQHILKKFKETQNLLTKCGTGQIANLVYPLYTGRTIDGRAIARSLVIVSSLTYIYLFLVSIFFKFNSLVYYMIFTIN